MFVTDTLTEFLAGKRKNTARTYRAGLKRWTDHCARIGQPLDTMQITDLPISLAMGFVTSLASTDLAAASCNAYMGALAAFYSYILLINDNCSVSHNDILRLRALITSRRKASKSVRLPRVPEEAHVMALLEYAYAAPDHTPRFAMIRLRNIALLEALRSTGARVTEIVSLRVKDLVPEYNGARVCGKGGTERIVFFSAPALDAIGDYLQLRGDPGNGSPLFARHDRQANPEDTLSANAVRMMIAAYAVAAGLPDDHGLHPHAFRHRFATRAITETGLAVTQDLMGHASPETTRIYTMMDPEVLAKAHGTVSL